MADKEPISPTASPAPAVPPPSVSSQGPGEVGPPKPTVSAEQKQYWKLDLRYKVIQLFVSGVGFALVIVGLIFNYLQTGNAAKATRAHIGSAVLTHVTNLDKVFMEKPYLMPYFHRGQAIDKKHEKHLEVQATAMFVLDVFDLLADQNKHFVDYWDKPAAWDDWMIDVFANSPILRETFDEHQNYYHSLKDHRKRGEAKVKGSKETPS